MFALKPFQEEAISKLKDSFINLWSLKGTNFPLVFKSPTGSGKTVMMAQFLRDIIADPRFEGNNVAFVWLTFSEDSYEQSKKKLFDYYGGAAELDLLDLNDLSQGRLFRNDVFFINWQKLKGQSKESRKLRRENEQGITFDLFMQDTHASGCQTILVIDEEHIGSNTELAAELIEGVIKPKISIRVSATPKSVPRMDEIGAFVEVPAEEVIAAGLIKEKILFQTEEDLKKAAFKHLDQDETLLELAIQKRTELTKEYEGLNVQVNPLVLIQLPNDDSASRETSDKSKQSIVLNYLKSRGIREDEIAIWLSEEKENLEEIERNDSGVTYLLFKQAAATGWDCPRASVLIMFREIKNPTFAIQTVGRILRMPFGEHFPSRKLNLGYLYTNYQRHEVIAEYAKSKTENRPAIHLSTRKKDIKPLRIESTFMTRADYNDLGDTFQNTFRDVAKKELNKKNLKLAPLVTNGLIVGVEIDNFDNFASELMGEGSSYYDEMSRHDLERLYNLLCFVIIAKQTDKSCKFAPERSWGKLKTALNVYFVEELKLTRIDAYRTIVHDLISESSLLKPVINKALAAYRPIRAQEVNQKVLEMKRVEVLEVPPESLYFTDLFEVVEAKKSALEPFFVEKVYVGRKNEIAFVEFMEKSNGVVWWHKNGDYGSEHFAVPYFDSEAGRERLFYPDWIVKTRNRTWIIDTKAGITADSAETKDKAEALIKWSTPHKELSAGIAVMDTAGTWKVNTSEEYFYDSNMKGWSDLNF
jgi:type III restriction enzyme